VCVSYLKFKTITAKKKKITEKGDSRKITRQKKKTTTKRRRV
jgi:hypothetical protein